MMPSTPRKRDYKVEYARRIARGLKKGKTKAEARGHARVAKSVSLSDERLARARELEAAGLSRTRAAKEAHISTERYAATYRRGFVRSRSVIIGEKGVGSVEIKVDAKEGHHVGQYLSAVKTVAKNGGADTSALESFDGDIVFDLEGVPHELEADWNVLSEDDEFEDFRYETLYN